MLHFRPLLTAVDSCFAVFRFRGHIKVFLRYLRCKLVFLRAVDWYIAVQSRELIGLHKNSVNDWFKRLRIPLLHEFQPVACFDVMTGHTACHLTDREHQTTARSPNLVPSTSIISQLTRNPFEVSTFCQKSKENQYRQNSTALKSLIQFPIGWLYNVL